MKGSWFQQKALEAKGGNIVERWYGTTPGALIKDRGGMVPVRTAVVMDENGKKCITPECQQKRLRRDFT